MKIHKPRWPGHPEYNTMLCGVWHGAVQTTVKDDEVTCKRCLSIINKESNAVKNRVVHLHKKEEYHSYSMYGSARETREYTACGFDSKWYTVKTTKKEKEVTCQSCLNTLNPLIPQCVQEEELVYQVKGKRKGKQDKTCYITKYIRTKEKDVRYAVKLTNKDLPHAELRIPYVSFKNLKTAAHWVTNHIKTNEWGKRELEIVKDFEEDFKIELVLEELR